MSVSLVVIRLEVKDECSKLPDFAYEAPDVVIHDGEKLTYAEILVSNVSHPKALKETLAHHRGRRHFAEITIETYFTEDKGQASKLIDNTETADKTIKEMFAEVFKEDSSDVVPSSGAVAEAAVTVLTKSKGPRQLSGSLDGSCTGEGDGPGSRPASGKGRAKSHSPTAQMPNTIHFFSGNPSVETTEGIIHLYKDNHLRSLTDDVYRSDMICILTVPASMNSPDFLQFMAPVEPGVESMKIIRDGAPNKYMVLVKFKDQKYADEFYISYNNMPFNSIEPEICHLVYVAKLEAVKASDGGSLPVPGLTELPVCPVCLERMDESVDGILTILCNHSFHSSCLARWEDTSCPVCRYVQTPEPVEDNKCFECESKDSLWICLICGHVGCGRYVEGHAYRHFQETQHTYSMQLGNNIVWDYAGDNYVHRLVQNKGDGKLVEVDEGGNVVQDQKLDSITLEYTYLLTSQLESQRHYFEEKIKLIEKEALTQVEELEVQSKAALEQCAKLEQHLSTSGKEKHNLEKKCSQLNTKLSKVQSDLNEEKEMNKCLLANQTQWQERVDKLEKQLHKKDKEVADLQEQMRDLMFYFEAQDKLAKTTVATQDEIQEGQIIVGNSPQGATGGKKSRKKGR